MDIKIATIFVITLGLVLAEPLASRHPKSVFNLAAMAYSYIPCPYPYFPIPYGCWCGITITPPDHPPIDIFDQHCSVHDKCYDDGVASGCSILDEYFWNYKWSMVEGQIVCSEKNSRCQSVFCECDKAVIIDIAQVADEVGCPAKNPGCPAS